MADVTELLRNGGSANQRSVVSGYVSRNMAAPTSFSDPLWVIVPDYSTDRPWGPCEWGAIHGATLPVQGARVLMAFDGGAHPTVIFWAGTHS